MKLPNALPALAFSSTFSALGPFPIGTREAEWSADPVGRYNISSLTPGNATFPSGYGLDGKVGWGEYAFAKGEGAAGSVTVKFPGDWEKMEGWYGWAALQFQGWLKGWIDVPGEGEEEVGVVFEVTGALEFRVNGEEYYGADVYGSKRAGTLVYAKPGRWAVEVRMAGDVRGFGGVAEVTVGLRAWEARGLVEVEGSVVMSDVVEGRMVGDWVSVGFMNEGREWVEVYEVEGPALADLPVRFAPGQSRPVKMQFRHAEAGERLELGFKYRPVGEGDAKGKTVMVKEEFNVVEKWWMPQKFTYLHPAEVVSYSVLQPPSPNAPAGNEKLPVLISLHGSGVEADSQEVRESFKGLPNLGAWLLLPSGGSAWCGDDWHRWGFVDVETALEAIPEWMERTQWNRQQIDLTRWVIAGHSNGGQGALYTLTHRSDHIIAAAPLAGYLSVNQYVPYTFWYDSDPRKAALIKTSLASYTHELLAPNTIGKPILLQSGAEDDNVPAHNSRKMHQLISDAGGSSEYIEIPGRDHWWPEVMTDNERIRGFFLEHAVAKKPVIPELPERFSLVVPNPADMGSRGGIKVDQLETSERLGRVDVERSAGRWIITTENIRRWHIESPNEETIGSVKQIELDGQSLDAITDGSATYLRSSNGDWKLDSSEWRETERSGDRLGAMDAFLSTKARISIVVPSDAPAYQHSIALSISRNFYQYYAADTEIITPEQMDSAIGNIVFLGLPKECKFASLTKDHLIVSDAAGRKHRYQSEPGLGAVFLQPFEGGRLVLSVWGADEEGMRLAARLVPATRTGVGAPEFVLVGKEMRWMGVAGTKAMGVFDSEWGLRL